MGGQNVLSGIVQGIAPLLGAGGSFAVRLDGRGLSLGRTVEFAVRRDRVRRAAADGAGIPGVNAVSGTVRAVEYQDTFVKATLAPDGIGARSSSSM